MGVDSIIQDLVSEYNLILSDSEITDSKKNEKIQNVFEDYKEQLEEIYSENKTYFNKLIEEATERKNTACALIGRNVLILAKHAKYFDTTETSDSALV
ncbi:MAG: hypothetical protein ChlgKO_06190 [Chlamydiales bacterium]